MTPTTTKTVTRRRPSRRRKASTGPLLTAAGAVGLQVHVERLALEVKEYGELMGDPKRDERVPLELERLIEQIDRYQALIAEARVIGDDEADAAATVGIGVRAKVRFADGSTEVVRVVHPAEAFLDDERVSSEAPLAKALIGLSAGDEGRIQAPAGVHRFTVEAVGAGVDGAPNT